jgi:hypothetical protein
VDKPPKMPNSQHKSLIWQASRPIAQKTGSQQALEPVQQPQSGASRAQVSLAKTTMTHANRDEAPPSKFQQWLESLKNKTISTDWHSKFK